MSTYERIPVDSQPAAVVSELREAARSQGFTEYAVVDHGHDMAAAGAPGFTAWTLVFGRPAGGAKLLARDTEAAVDIPLHLAVVAGADSGSEIVLRDMRSLLDDELADIADEFTGSMRAIATEAADSFTA